MKTETQCKILFVDDDHLFCDMASDLIFQFIGIRVRLAHNGAEAEDIVKDWLPDVIITDTNMPIKNGVELIREVHSKNPQIVIFSFFNGLNGSSITSKDIETIGAFMVLGKFEISSRLLPALKQIIKL
jgi:two-component system response regulator YesN